MNADDDKKGGKYKYIRGKISNLSRENVIFIVVAFSVVALLHFIPTPEGLSHNGKIMIGILIMGGILWATEAIPLAVTGLLIIIIQPLLGVLPAKDVFSSFGNQAVFFLIGAFILAGAVEKHGLHKRIALKLLSYFEKSPKIFTLGIMSSCAFLSFIMPEHGVAALFLPIVASILIAMKITPRQSNFGKISMLSIAYGCSIGSLGTLVGGARNPLTVGLLSDLNPPINVTFFDWMTYSMPIVFIALPLVWLVLQISFPIEIKSVLTAKKEINKQVSIAGKMGRYEIMVSGILALTVFLWIFFSSPQYLGLAVVAIVGSILLFFTGCINWKDVEERVPWGIILLYGGAITLGVGMQQTGAGAWIAHRIFDVTGNNPYLVILGLIIFTVLLTNVMSNVGAVAILLPIGLSLATEVPGVNPLFASMLIALSGGLAFMLVIATPGNAITYSSGYFSSKDLFKAGVIANIVCIGIIFIIAIFYWKGVLGL
ncbi:MAG: DASS family sodium-coupled anion symporter [Thermoplasmatales archaeon]|nr:MAG: DASS family sodium-coupled anion symporter [Thermoplasmatales archaeon]